MTHNPRCNSLYFSVEMVSILKYPLNVGNVTIYSFICLFSAIVPFYFVILCPRKAIWRSKDTHFNCIKVFGPSMHKGWCEWIARNCVPTITLRRKWVQLWAARWRNSFLLTIFLNRLCSCALSSFVICMQSEKVSNLKNVQMFTFDEQYVKCRLNSGQVHSLSMANNAIDFS